MTLALASIRGASQRMTRPTGFGVTGFREANQNVCTIFNSGHDEWVDNGGVSPKRNPSRILLAEP